MDKMKAQQVARCSKCGLTWSSHPSIPDGLGPEGEQRWRTECPAVPVPPPPMPSVEWTKPCTGPPTPSRFHVLLAELGALHDRKSRGYGTAADPYANHRRAAEWGTPAWTSPARRIDEKMQRVRGCVKVGAAESQVDVREELLDVAVLALIAVVLWEEGTYAE